MGTRTSKRHLHAERRTSLAFDLRSWAARGHSCPQQDSNNQRLWIVGRLVPILRCCGQECPRAGVLLGRSRVTLSRLRYHAGIRHFLPGSQSPRCPQSTCEANCCILRHVTPITLQKALYVAFSQIAQPPQVVCLCRSQFPFPEGYLAGVGQFAHAHQASIREVFSRRSRIRKRTKRRTVALSAPPWPGKQSTPAPSSQGLDTATPSGSATIATGPRRRRRSWVCEALERGQEHQI